MVGILANEANEVKRKWVNLLCCIRSKKNKTNHHNSGSFSESEFYKENRLDSDGD